LTDEKGLLCGRILADLGCDVIKIEKPGGDRARTIGPFYHNMPDREKSLYWFAYNANKRGITLDITTSDGKELFGKLAEKADFVIESFQPGYMDGLGLGYDDLSAIHPGVIMISISPFGQTGPYRNFKSPDIVSMAMGGSMYVCGEPDRAPVRIGLSQACLHSGAEAASAGLIALYRRDETGEGQHVDLSMQECINWTLMLVQPSWDLTGTITKRGGVFRKLVSGIFRRNLWPCKDGHVSFMLLGGLPGARTNRALIELMDSKGYATEVVKQMDWESFDMAKTTQEEIDRIFEPIGKFFLAHTKNELYEEALNRQIQLYPVSTAKDIVEDAQLNSREFWVEIDHPELDTAIVYPGAFAKFSRTPMQRKSPAPRIGEDNRDIYMDELGMSERELLILSQGGII